MMSASDPYNLDVGPGKMLAPRERSKRDEFYRRARKYDRLAAAGEKKADSKSGLGASAQAGALAGGLGAAVGHGMAQSKAPDVRGAGRSMRRVGLAGLGIGSAIAAPLALSASKDAKKASIHRKISRSEESKARFLAGKGKELYAMKHGVSPSEASGESLHLVGKDASLGQPHAGEGFGDIPVLPVQRGVTLRSDVAGSKRLKAISVPSAARAEQRVEKADLVDMKHELVTKRDSKPRYLAKEKADRHYGAGNLATIGAGVAGGQAIDWGIRAKRARVASENWDVDRRFWDQVGDRKKAEASGMFSRAHAKGAKKLRMKTKGAAGVAVGLGGLAVDQYVRGRKASKEGKKL